MVATITITDRTQPVQSLFNLMAKGSLPGYTVAPAGGLFPLTMLGGVSYLSIQASPRNGGTVIYVGDENVKNDGSRQGKEMQAGDVDVHQAHDYTCHLGEIYLTASANNAIFSVEVHYT